ncbi:MAG: TetR/AcrR family transcriptional regulator [Lachnospiraceae bacterium]|nr:TetR/AcrR family transcriptional regulator [Lachnospiraceae bacterium]MBP5745000.1 TetR/AcrR family transcriptional regulator [Lachnospiraceae bacterium]
MKEKAYHHGNLKNELIEKGLEYIDRYGVESLSMRELARAAGVSSAAPYAHFQNKEAFLNAVWEYITDQFYNRLEETNHSCSDKNRLLIDLGKCYVMFFYENPLYYQFLFTRTDIELSEYKPFILFEDLATDYLNEHINIGRDSIHSKILALWSMVHGLAQLVTVKGVIDKDNLGDEVEKILSSVSLGGV